jgi:endoglucanase
MLSAGLAPLGTLGAQIVDCRTGVPVRLRGVNRSGMEYAEPRGDASFLEAAGLDEGELQEIGGTWRANVIRVPFNQDFVLRGRGARSAAEYLDALDRLIAWAAASGAYTVLDLQWMDADTAFGRHHDGTVNRVPPLPNAASIDAWGTLAARYRDEPAVLFDLFNEPHDPTFDDVNPLMGVLPSGELWRLPGRQVGMEEWQPWARKLIDVTRAERPDALVFVSGVGWAYDLRGMPLIDRAGNPLPNVVYSTHVYPWLRTRTFARGSLEADWTRAFGHLAERVPVFAGEWGGGNDDLGWGQRLNAYFDRLGMGWAAWSWADWPTLVGNCRACDYTPTAFGGLVKQALCK